MKKTIVSSACILALAFVGYSYAVPPGQPFQELLNLINGLDTRVTALEASGGGGAQRQVISDTVDLNAPGDVVFETFDTLGRRRLDHHVEILVPGLTTVDLPAVSLYRRRRTTARPISPPFDAFNSGFVLHPGRLQGSDITTLLSVADGKILLRYRRDSFELDGVTVRRTDFGLDGEGGTGDFRLVLIR